MSAASNVEPQTPAPPVPEPASEPAGGSNDTSAMSGQLADIQAEVQRIGAALDSGLQAIDERLAPIEEWRNEQRKKRIDSLLDETSAESLADIEKLTQLIQEQRGELTMVREELARLRSSQTTLETGPEDLGRPADPLPAKG